MEKMNVITGVPRSGSTLVCNVLNQNPEFYASSTSPLPTMVSAFIGSVSHSQEVQAAMQHNREFTSYRLDKIAQDMATTWYADKPNVVFDKGRGWSFNGLVLTKAFPGAKSIVCVRDLRAVFGSVEKQHRKNPMIDLATNPNEKTIYARANAMMGPTGMIGQCVVGVMDLIDRCPDDVFILQYEAFTRDPKTKLMELYEFIGEEYYEDHDFDNVENVSEDLDVLYHDKFPHEGSGKIVPCDRTEWSQFLSPELANEIYKTYPNYNQKFGY